MTVKDSAGCVVDKNINVLEITGPKILYVSPLGDDANLGTRSNPLRSVQFAVDSSCTDDTIVLTRGIYKGAVDLNSKRVILRSDFEGNNPTRDDISQTILEGLVDGNSVLSMSGEVV